jgi:hypothetical protein
MLYLTVGRHMVREASGIQRILMQPVTGSHLLISIKQLFSTVHVAYVLQKFSIHASTSGVPRGGGVNIPPPNFRSFDKAEPKSVPWKIPP